MTTWAAEYPASIAAGFVHSCAATTAGAAKCWGDNSSGQLGNGTLVPSLLPVGVSGLAGGVLAVTGGYGHSCALTSNGGVKCWGRNDYGQLGDGSTTNRSTPADVSGLSSGVAALSAGLYHTCAVLSNGNIRCWGRNDYGQIGDGTLTHRPAPVDVVGLGSSALGVSGGDHHTCAVLATGSAMCWGFNGNGELGTGDTAQRLTPAYVIALTGVTAIAAGTYHTCALAAGGSAKCWGINDIGQLGTGTTSGPQSTPLSVSGIASGATAITTASSHSCAIVAGGLVRCWGNNFNGQLGDGTPQTRTSPVTVLGMPNGAFSVTAGGNHTCVVTGSGDARCWGAGASGELGNGSSGNQLSPDDVEGLSNGYVRAAAGIDFSCGLTASGEARCWGNNTAGQLGDGTYTSRSAPAPITSTPPNPGRVAAGARHACVEASGNTTCWGENTYGQLGDGTTVSRNAPGPIITESVSLIGGGDSHSCALAGGGIKCWGRNSQGQVGDGTTVDKPTPTSVTGSAGWIGVATGREHACAHGPGGGGPVYCWGAGSNGQLGNGSFGFQSSPVNVSGLGGTVTALGTGHFHTCAVSGGAFRCWGNNGSGQLGTGSTGGLFTTPVAVAGISGASVMAITGGVLHTCILTTGGGVKCAGDNSLGQLGNGTTTSSNTFVDTLLTSGVVAIAAGAHHTCATLTGNVLLCWGANAMGQLGDGTTANKLTPTPVYGPQSITFTLGVSSFPVGASMTLTASATSYLPVTFETWTPSACTRSGDTLTFVGVGACAVRATQPGSASDHPATPVLKVVAVTQGTQSISFGTLSGKTFGDPAFTISATGGPSGNPVTFFSLTPLYCSTSGPTVTILAAGECTIAANQAGSVNYTAAPQVTQSFTIAQAPQSIAFDPLPGRTFGDAPFSIAATGGGSGNAVTFTSDTLSVCSASGINGATIALAAAGDCTIRAHQAGSPNYLAAPDVTRTFTVGKAAQAIAFGALSGRTLGDAPFNVSATGGASGNPVTFSTLTGSVCSSSGTNGATITILAAGTCTVAANQAGNGNFNAAPEATQSFAVARAPSTVGLAVSPSGPTYFTVTVTLTATVSGTVGVPGGTVAFKDGGSAIAGCAAVPLVAGSAQCATTALPEGTRSLTADYPGDPAYAPGTSPAAPHIVQLPVLSVFKAGTGGGAVVSTPSGVNCGGDCSEFFLTNAAVTLAANADANSFFTGWSGSCAGIGLCNVTMDASKFASAAFARVAESPRFASGTAHSLAIRADGTLWAWGDNFYGQLGLGDGSGTDRLTPVQVGTGTDWIAVAAGAYHSLAIRRDGTLWAWGRGDFGQLGDGLATPQQNSPAQVGSGADWVQVSGGANHSAAVRANGTLWAWGWNLYGEVGDGTSLQRNAPVQVGSATTWVSASAGGGHTLAFRSDGTLWAFGRNDYGQLGDGFTVNRPSPVQVGSASDWLSSAAGDLHSVAINAAGKLFSWGANFAGQLGYGSLDALPHVTPSQVGAFNWLAASAGTAHTAATRIDGTYWAWGKNDNGQLGDGTFADRQAPVQVGTATQWAAVAAGGLHSLALRSDGSFHGAGGNLDGQVGDGSTALRNSPVAISLSGTAPPTVRPVDFNADGKSDLLWLNADGRYAVWLMNGLGPTATSEILAAGTGFVVKHIADFDGDGKADLYFEHADGRAAIWLMNGGVPSATVQILNAGSGWTALHTGDLNGDGKADIVWQHTDGSIAAWLMNGTAMSSGSGLLGAGTGWSVAHVGDFDGDGRKDLYWQHTDGRAAIWLMNGLTPTATNQILNAASGWSAVHVADVSGDGKADIVWQHTDGSVAVWLMNGAAMASGSGILSAGTGWSVARTADFDGDGKKDLYWQHTDGRAAIWLMNGLTPASTAQILNAASGWSLRRTADLNGDGKADLVWQHTDGSVAAWLMNGAAMASGTGILGPASGWSVSNASP